MAVVEDLMETRHEEVVLLQIQLRMKQVYLFHLET